MIAAKVAVLTLCIEQYGKKRCGWSLVTAGNRSQVANRLDAVRQNEGYLT
jgi:hypothetical protein